LRIVTEKREMPKAAPFLRPGKADPVRTFPLIDAKRANHSILTETEFPDVNGHAHPDALKVLPAGQPLTQMPQGSDSCARSRLRRINRRKAGMRHAKPGYRLTPLAFGRNA
jgi:hypothetical protein